MPLRPLCAQYTVYSSIIPSFIEATRIHDNKVFDIGNSVESEIFLRAFSGTAAAIIVPLAE